MAANGCQKHHAILAWRYSWLGLLGLAFLVLSGTLSEVLAEEPPNKGLAIAQEMDRRNDGFGNTIATLKMILRNAHGQPKTRELKIRTKEVPDIREGDKIFIVFDRPRDIKGTALLTHTHIGKPDDQWLYLPALKRVKRIASTNQSGSFVGSEFAYEDLTSQEVDKYTHRYLRDEVCGMGQCFVVERVPVAKHSGYKRQIVWIDQREYRLHKNEFYDRKNRLLKTLLFNDYEQYLGQYWRALQMDMTNHQTGKSTQLQFSEYRFRESLTKRDFTRAALKRVR
ncbi:MAG: hypothetical protein ETSY2_05245 [Candidatus Entotheonella gemina]|uniref:Uncharacterized protein TP-0789 domain-containing protein n=1 Tax=Candidatus Entotheonella gemina TaxID=1429439 RepID=W4ME57_9BACT|nr:MAG: hypothetical protein ETSY2_05245 [Candidatus Entotheonella gemina]